MSGDCHAAIKHAVHAIIVGVFLLREIVHASCCGLLTDEAVLFLVLPLFILGWILEMLAVMPVNLDPMLCLALLAAVQNQLTVLALKQRARVLRLLPAVNQAVSTCLNMHLGKLMSAASLQLNESQTQT